MSHHYTIQNKLCTVLETYIWYSSRRTYIWSKEVRERNFRVGIARGQKKRDDNIRERPGEEKRRRGERGGGEGRREEMRGDERRWENGYGRQEKERKENNRGEDKRCEKRQEERRREERGEERGARSGGEQRRGGRGAERRWGGRDEDMKRSLVFTTNMYFMIPIWCTPESPVLGCVIFWVLTFLKLKSWCPSQTNEACRH